MNLRSTALAAIGRSTWLFFPDLDEIILPRDACTMINEARKVCAQVRLEWLPLLWATHGSVYCKRVAVQCAVVFSLNSCYMYGSVPRTDGYCMCVLWGGILPQQGNTSVLMPVYNAVCRTCNTHMSIERATWTGSNSLSHILQSYEQITNVPDKDTGFIGYQLAGDPAQVGSALMTTVFPRPNLLQYMTALDKPATITPHRRIHGYGAAPRCGTARAFTTSH